MPSQLDSLIIDMQHGHIPLPLVVSEGDACRIISYVKSVQVSHLSEIDYIPDVFLYAREEEKDIFSIKIVHEFIAKVSQKPLYPPAISILRDIDTAIVNGMNALLKVLEEPPPGNIILLTVSHYDFLIPTITSRTMFISENIPPDSVLPIGFEEALDAYIEKNPLPLMRLLYKGKYSREEALAIIQRYSEKICDTGVIQGNLSTTLSDAMIDLETTNANPRNILDQVFILLW